MPLRLKILVYPFFAAFSLLFFLVVLFPFDSVKNRLSREIERQLGDQYSISIGKFSPSPLTGVVLKDVEIRLRDRPQEAPIKLSKAKLKFSILPFFSGGTEVAFDLRAGQGKASGLISSRKNGMGLEIKMDQFDLSVAGFLTQRAGISMTGLLNGVVQMDLFPQDPLRNTGKISLEIPDLRLGEIRLGGGAVQIPAMRLAQQGNQKSRVDIAIERGNLEVKEMQLAGGDLSLQANGKIYGARQVNNYRFNLKGNFKVADEMAGKLRPLLTIIEKQKVPDGAYPFTVTGRISKPNIRVGDFKVPI